MKKRVFKYTAVFQKEPEGGYTVYIPILPGCVSYGKDLDEAQKMIQEALELYLESMADHKEEIPSEQNVFYSQINIKTSDLHTSYA
ncbi:antitoxin HicB [Candidatus Roizmanbacteria bacterium CG_4_9_14_0_2_um_filter_39_13]|uniref:Antitoxin HicB n=1 Tax=Candidatus Roizmanbacteria bacterium CG_4_9_14_0_2_um_filter_39_13 TaxID=1974839 RepID=A0A2M8EWM4_9BACT|nr:MAG: antitoxin HicB [Candidatus Roizmanbacteria bacterium CG_4_9_14_0_2_um_filter_39_13]